MTKKPLGITEVVLRDAHQSLFATRMRIEDMLPIAAKLDKMGYWSIESWGGATFDACIRFLGEDPWERIRRLKSAMPNTPQQMLLRGQNLLGYRHYADDVVTAFVERCAANGIDVFRIFDAMNDTRNLETAIKAAIAVDKHAQGTISYTVSPVHTMDTWLTLAKQIEAMGAHSICIKDMAGLLKPYVAEELVSRLKEQVSIPLALHCHATTGLSTATIVKAVEAGVDMVDTSISSMSMTYGHSPTESIVSIFEDTDKHTKLNIEQLEEIAAYFRDVRKKYAKFEGSLRGVDSRILVAQVPGGMLTNMENQLREQGAIHQMDAVLEEIPKVRKDLGYIPLVTPTSQIVGTQSVINVLSGERYNSISKETADVLRGEYGSTPAPVNSELQARVLDGHSPVTCRPADLIAPEMTQLTAELDQHASEKNINLAEAAIDDVLTYALFNQTGLRFLENRGNADAFEPAPDTPCVESVTETVRKQDKANTESSYDVLVNGRQYAVTVAPEGQLTALSVQSAASQVQQLPSEMPVSRPEVTNNGVPVAAPLAGNIVKVPVRSGQHVEEGELLVVLEAMKMETEVKAPHSGVVAKVVVGEGDNVSVGDELLQIG